MLTNIEVNNYGGENGITFYLDVDTLSFDYSNMTRVCSVRLYAVSGAGGAVLRSGLTDGSVTIFGKTFVLPQTVTLGSYASTTIGSWTIYGVSNTEYPSSAYCNVTLTYSCDEVYMYDYSGTFIVDIGAIHLAPIASVVGGNRSELGSFLEFSGDIFSEGYDISASVKYSISTYYMHSLQNKGNGFYSQEYWIADSKYSTEFDAVVTLSASYNGVPLPNTYTLTVTFYLGEDNGLPQANVVTGFRSDSAAVEALGIGVKNKSSFFVDVSDLRLHFGASLRRRIITIDGQSYDAESAQTPVLTESGEHTWSVTIEDSRWKRQTYSGVFTVRDYGLPEFSVSLLRTDQNGSESKNGGYISLILVPQKEYIFDGLNPYEYSFSYRDVGSAEASGEISIAAGESYLYNARLESGVAYEIVVKGRDSLGSETEKRYILESERIELNIAKDRVAVGKKAQKDKVFECAWDIEGNGDISFIDGNGVRKSIRNIYENETPACSLVSVSDESGISAALQNIAESARGCSITLINVEKSGLSLEKGLNAYLSFRTGGQTLTKKL